MIRHALRICHHIATAAAVTYVSLFMVPAAHASGSSMPWEAPLQSILDSVEGPVAKIVAVIIIIVTGLTLAFGDTGGGFRRLIQIVFGISIAFAASSFFLSFFCFTFSFRFGQLSFPFFLRFFCFTLSFCFGQLFCFAPFFRLG